MKYLFFILLIGSPVSLLAQSLDLQILEKEKEIQSLQNQITEAKTELETLKLKKSIEDLKAIGLPTEEYTEHSAMILQYSEHHKQAQWVAHKISYDILQGAEGRTDDFRSDPKISTGTAIQEDYFLTDTMLTGRVEYDGFGYDRGHLAPSADFRWSQKAVSESYYYSNISPQSPEFNQGKWVELESHLRNYVICRKTDLYVLTAPVLTDDLPYIKRSVNKVTIPKQFIKAVYDPKSKIAIAFLMDNKALYKPVDMYAISVDEAEAILGIDIFSSVDEEVESSFDKKKWFSLFQLGEVDPIPAHSLPKNHFNTIQAKKRIGKNTTVCGKVVGTHISKKGHLWINLDRKFPNQLLSIFVEKDNLIHFQNDMNQYALNKKMCFTGKVENKSRPQITIRSGHDVKLWPQQNENVNYHP